MPTFKPDTKKDVDESMKKSGMDKVVKEIVESHKPKKK